MTTRPGSNRAQTIAAPGHAADPPSASTASADLAGNAAAIVGAEAFTVARVAVVDRSRSIVEVVDDPFACP